MTFFFRDHPRWATRDQRAEKAYSGALAEYNQRWPDPTHSPGGQPPVVAFVGNPRSTTNNTNGTADLALPVYCRNASEPVSLVIHFSKDTHLVQSNNEQCRDSAGNLEVRQQILCLDRDDADPLGLHLPASLVSEKDRKVEAHAVVVTSTGEILERFKDIDVHFPKRNLRAGKVTASQTETAVLVQTKTRTEDPVNRRTPVSRTAVDQETAKLNLTAQESPNQQASEHPAPSYVANQMAEPPPESVNPDSGLGVVGSIDGVYGLKIVEVTPGSPAANAGLVPGDTVLAVDGVKVNSEQVLYAQFANREPGAKVIATIRHGGWTYSVTITTQTDVPAFDHSLGFLFPGHTVKIDH